MEKKGFARNCHFQGTANFRYLEAIKCHFEAINGKFGQILIRIHSHFIFCPLHLAVKGHCRKSPLSRNSKFRVLRDNYVPFLGQKYKVWTPSLSHILPIAIYLTLSRNTNDPLSIGYGLIRAPVVRFSCSWYQTYHICVCHYALLI